MSTDGSRLDVVGHVGDVEGERCGEGLSPRQLNVPLGDVQAGKAGNRSGGAKPTPVTVISLRL